MKLTLLALVSALSATSALPAAAPASTAAFDPSKITDITYPIQQDVYNLLEAVITALQKLPGDLTQIPNRFENGEGELAAITAITG